MSNLQEGKVIQVIGAVVDIAFRADQELPAVYNAIEIKDENGQVPVDIVAEVMQHLGDEFDRRSDPRHESGGHRRTDFGTGRPGCLGTYF